MLRQKEQKRLKRKGRVNEKRGRKVKESARIRPVSFSLRSASRKKKIQNEGKKVSVISSVISSFISIVREYP